MAQCTVTPVAPPLRLHLLFARIRFQFQLEPRFVDPLPGIVDDDDDSNDHTTKVVWNNIIYVMWRFRVRKQYENIAFFRVRDESCFWRTRNS